jgi:ribosome-associated toxin RatA of RatAB toxin-antitoxin module
MFQILFKFFLLCLLPLPLMAKEAALIEIETSHKADLVDVKVQALISATPQTIWATLTDYERLPEFVPGLKSSKIVERKGSVVTVKQSGVAVFLFFKVPIDVTVESTEAWPVLEVRRVAGTVRQLQGRYEMIILPDNSSVRLIWTGSIEPENSLPPLIGESLMRRSIRQQFTGMVREIERRAAKQESLMPTSTKYRSQ